MKLKFDLHIHSEYSHDSTSKIASIIRKAKKSGLDGIAVTDHEEFRGAEAAAKIAKDFIVIKGQEIDTEYGDIVGLFLKRKIMTKKFMDVVAEIRKQGGIVVLPHPAKFHILSDEVLKEVDVVEVFNARVGDRENVMASRLAAKNGKVGIAGSDAHFLFEIGNGVSILNVRDSSIDKLRDAILKGRVEMLTRRSNKFLRGVALARKILKR